MNTSMSVANGGKLDDCHSSIYSLADLTGLRWKTFSGQKALPVSPSDDPILGAFSNCLAQDILAVWRKAPNVKKSTPSITTPHNLPFNDDEMNSTSHFEHKKELWIFWWGNENEPAVEGVGRTAGLSVDSEGSWEDVGLSYDCRTLLFKAIHNLIERCLLSENFVRIGKWFLRPYRKEAHEEIRDRLSVCFSFFLRGENTVCATVDIAQHQAVERVGNQFLSRAANNFMSRTVILSPYGLRAAFTGLVYKSPHDQAVKTVIDEWKGFYPINVIQEQMNHDNDNADLPVPPVIEVFLSGVRMNYPSAYVLIPVDMQSTQKEYENQSWNNEKRGLDCGSHHGDITSIGSFQDSMGLSMNEMANSPVSENARDLSPSVCEESGGSFVKKLISRVVNASQMSDTRNDFEMNGVHSHVGDGNNTASHDSAWPKLSCQFKKARQKKNYMPPSDDEMIFPGMKQKHDSVSGTDARRKADKQKQTTIVPFHHRCAEVQTSQRVQQKNITSSIPTHENNAMMMMYPPQSAGYQQWNQEEVTKPLDQPGGLDSMYFSNNIDMPQAPVSESFPVEPDIMECGIMDETIANTQVGEIKQHISIWKKVRLPRTDGKAGRGGVHKRKLMKPSLTVGNLETEYNSETSGIKRSNISQDIPPWPTGRNERKHKVKYEEVEVVSEGSGILEALFWNDNKTNTSQAVSKHFHVGEVTGELAGMAVRLDPYAFEDEDKDTDNTTTFNPPRTTEISLKQPSIWPGNAISSNFIDQKPAHPENFLQTNSVFSRGPSNFDGVSSMEKPVVSSLTKEVDLKVSPDDLDNLFDDRDDGVSASNYLEMPIVKSNNNNMMEIRGIYPVPHNDSFMQTFKRDSYPKIGNMNENEGNVSSNRYVGGSTFVESLSTLAKKLAGGSGGLGHMHMQDIRRNELPEVYSVDPLSKQPLTDKYAPITLKNKTDYGSGRMPPAFSYTPSWQMSVESYAQQNAIPNSMDTHEDLSFMQSSDAPTPISHSFSVKTPSSVPQQSPLPQQTPRTPRGSASPATSTPNPATHGRFAIHTPQTSVSSSVAQSDIGNCRASSIYVNLMLSDSVMNLFRDISFDQCPMCVCSENIRSRDVDLGYLPSMADNSSDGPACSCGFSAVRNRCLSVGTGLFLEDELEIVGKDLEAEIIKSRDAARKPADGAAEEIINFAVRQAPNPYLKVNVTGTLNMKCQVYNIACQQDIKEACVEAINGGITVMETGNQPKIQVHNCKNAIHNWIDTRMLKSISSVDLYQMLQFLKPVLQNAIQRQRTERQFNFIQRVNGPLTWREFCKDNTGALEPLPVPMLLVGQSHDWTTVSPFALDYWEKLYLEPYAGITNISYLVICPEIEHVFAAAKFFFSELSSLYDLCRLGSHKPLIRNFPDSGIICITNNIQHNDCGNSQKTPAESSNSEPTPLTNHVGGNTMKSVDAYVTACRDVLFPLFNIPVPVTIPKPEPDSQTFGPMPNSTGTPGSMRPPTPLPLPAKIRQGKDILQAQLATRHSINDNATILLYFIDPFIGSDSSAFSIAIWKCYSEIAKTLPEAKRNSVVIQIVPLEDILQYGGANEKSIVSTARSLAFSSYFQCRHRISHQASVRTMTAFGPATTKNQAAQENKLKLALPIHSPAYVLAGSKNSEKDSFSLEKRGIECNILYVTYCLSHDQKWIIASATDQDGEMLETFCVNIDVPPRRVSLRRKQRICVKAAAIEKLWKLCLSLITGTASMHWRIVIGRLGKLGHGEIQEWAKHLNRPNFSVLAKQVATKCTQCMLNGTYKHASIFSACLTSLEPEGSFTILPDLVKLAPFGRTANSGTQVQLKTPEDTSCTHIYVFPTSSLVQTAAGGTFQNENLDFELNFPEFGEQDEIPIEVNDLFDPAPPGGNAHQMDDICHAKPQQDRLGSTDIQEDIVLQQQPLALGYLVSTAPTGPLPDFFWVPCTEAQFRCPVFLRFALHIQVSSDEVQNMGGADTNDQHHQLDSHKTAQVLRYVMENYNALSWLTCDPVSRDRRSCLPIHYFVLTRLYHTIKDLT